LQAFVQSGSRAKVNADTESTDGGADGSDSDYDDATDAQVLEDLHLQEEPSQNAKPRAKKFAAVSPLFTRNASHIFGFILRGIRKRAALSSLCSVQIEL
jgi:hypothetical protein